MGETLSRDIAAEPQRFRLSDTATIAAFTARVDAMAKHEEASEAYGFAQHMQDVFAEHPEFAKTKPEAFAAYQDMILDTRCVALPLLEPRDIVQLLEQHAVHWISLLAPERVLKDKLNEKLVAMGEYKERNVLKQQIQEALLRNTEMFTKSTIPQDGKAIKGTLGNWLREYTKAVGTSVPDALRQAEFITSPLVTKLSPEEREQLKRVIEFFESLKISSLTPEGLEEKILYKKNGKLYVLRNGVEELIEEPPSLTKSIEIFAAVKGQEAMAEQPQHIVAKYRGDPKQEEILGKEMQLALDATGGDERRLRNYCFDALQGPLSTPSARVQGIAALRAVARANVLPTLLQHDDRFADMVKGIFQQAGKMDAVKDFSLHPSSPRYVGTMLRTVLQDFMKLPAGESARHALHVVNNLPSEDSKTPYAELIYFDLAKGEFAWK